MINYQEAQNMIINLSRSFGKEQVKLDDAFGKILAENILAERDYPPFNRSALDGYAFHLNDFIKGCRNFQVMETIFAGQENKVKIGPGQCYKIMTGAAVPVLANVVIRREDAVEENGLVTFQVEPGKKFQNIAVRGQDLKSGALALPFPFKLNASAIGLLASLGKEQVWVEKSPKTAIITTGNEVVALGQIASPLQIHNTNLHVLKALLHQQGIKSVKHRHVSDIPEEIETAIRQHLDNDLLILTGGVSAGDADYVPGILSNLGVKKRFHKAAIKPGKPIWCGEMQNKGLVFALPGNPFSCLVTFKIFVETYLRACNGLKTPALSKLPLNFNRTKRTSFDEFFPVSITGENAVLEESPLNGSGDIRLGSFSNALAIHPAQQMELAIGDEIYYIPLN